MATATVDGHMLFYTRPVKSEGCPVLLLLHGAGGSHLGWPREIQRLAGTNVYNLDLPGHGRSPGPGRATVEEYADVVQAFIDKLDLINITLIGHSMGGAIAQTLALRGLPEVGKMIILNSSAKLRVAPQLLDAARTEPQMAADLVARMSWSAGADKDKVRLSQATMLQIDPVVLHGDFLACDCFDIRSELNKISIPTLVVCGSEDQMTPPKFGRYLAENISGAQLVEIEDAGHFAMLEKPKEVANTIAEFLAINSP
jgi:pimeloyl-ACP methyl ester carboxylesterase